MTLLSLQRLATSMLCILSLLALSHLSYAEKTTYSFGVVPQQSAKKLAKLWTPVLKHVNKNAGINIRFKTAKNIPEFENRLAAGEYDFSYMNPYHFTVFNREPGYQAVAVRKDQPIKGIIVVKKGSDIKSIEQFANKKLAFPSPAAFAASVLPRAMLKQNNIAFDTKYVSSHDSVYLNVAKGLYVGGGGVMRTLNNTPAKVRDQLSVLWTSKGFTPHAIAAHPRVPENIRLAVQQALVDIAKDEKSNQLLKKLKIKKGLIAANNSDWDDVRGLGIDLLEQLIKE